MAETTRISRWGGLVVIIAAMTLISGCYYYKAFRQLKDHRKHYGLVGQIHHQASPENTVIVVLYSEVNGERAVVQYAFPEPSGFYSFFATDGLYYLAAFEDANNNLKFDEGEPAGYFGYPDRIAVSSESVDPELEAITGLDIHIGSQKVKLGDITDDIDVNALDRSSMLRIGVLTSLTNSKFEDKKGRRGYWKPLTFLRDYGFGVYFLDPYDSDKIPVLFVHGASGTPKGWEPIIAELDRETYQPWFYYYPSGLELNISSTSLNKIIKELHREYHFDRMHVIGHSIGGLVARSFINKNVKDTAGWEYIKAFVSIATPWGGIELAAKGAKKAPAAIPSWHDLDPQSEFINVLFSNRLPRSVRFHMLFSYRGDCSSFMGNNDGTVELSSMLDLRAQSEASEMWGYDEDHGSILTSRTVIEALLTVLESESETTALGYGVQHSLVK